MPNWLKTCVMYSLIHATSLIASLCAWPSHLDVWLHISRSWAGLNFFALFSEHRVVSTATAKTDSSFQWMGKPGFCHTTWFDLNIAACSATYLACQTVWKSVYLSHLETALTSHCHYSASVIFFVSQGQHVRGLCDFMLDWEAGRGSKRYRVSGRARQSELAEKTETRTSFYSPLMILCNSWVWEWCEWSCSWTNESVEAHGQKLTSESLTFYVVWMGEMHFENVLNRNLNSCMKKVNTLCAETRVRIAWTKRHCWEPK